MAVTNLAALFKYSLAEAIFTQAFMKAKQSSEGPEEMVTKEI